MTEVYVYLLDLFIPTDLRRSEVLRAFEEDKLKPFEFIREIIEDRVKGIRNVEFYNALFRGDEFLLEYTVDFANGRITIKIIGAEEPQNILSFV